MLPPANSAQSASTGLLLITGQRRRNLLLSVTIGLAILAGVALVGVIVTVWAKDVRVGLAVSGALIAVIVVSCAVFKSWVLARLPLVHDSVHLDGLRTLVADVSARLGMSPPKVLIMKDSVNAFAIGSGRGAVVVFSESLLQLFGEDPEAVEAVVAHELAHVANRDSWLGTALKGAMMWTRWLYVLLTFYARALRFVCDAFLAATRNSTGVIVSPIRMSCWICSSWIAPLIFRLGRVVLVAGHVLAMGLCRQREFAADATAAYVTGKPEALSRALSRLDEEETELRRGRHLVQELCVAPPHVTGVLAELFSTHPSTERRIARLSAYAEGTGEFRTGLALFVALLVTAVLLIGGAGVITLSSTAVSSYPLGAERIQPAPSPDGNAPFLSSAAPTSREDGVPSSAPSVSSSEPADSTPEPSARDDGADPPVPEPSVTPSARRSLSPPMRAARPSKVSVRAMSGRVIRVSWKDNSGNETAFTVNNGESSRTVDAGATSYDWRNLKPGTYMCFRVRAWNKAGTSRYSPVTDPYYRCTTTPRPAPKTSAPALLGPVDFDAYCVSAGADEAVLVADDAYGWRCRIGGEERTFSVTEACRSQYGTRKAIDKIIDFHDSSSWQCWRVSGRLGTADLDGFCRSQGAEAAISVADNAYGWRCRLPDGEEGGIWVADVCKWQYSRPSVLERMADYYNPESWECWT
ncbi:M48 family metalloprotease [Sphaerisporangium aureirubrum]|uniref:M48 family metalloprotease n=1 Tax=Sphaerisporangium aureirubrum TaxID=1544736 RepID=A0ABW1NHE1_9ACTN